MAVLRPPAPAQRRPPQAGQFLLVFVAATCIVVAMVAVAAVVDRPWAVVVALVVAVGCALMVLFTIGNLLGDDG